MTRKRRARLNRKEKILIAQDETLQEAIANKVIDEVKPIKQIHIHPKTYNQRELLKAIEHNPITIALGSAGTGKTYVSTSKVAQLFLTKKYEKIILSRSNIATGKSLGSFPGTVQEKMGPWLLPITSVLEKQFGFGYYKYLTNKNTIEVQPLETIRGRSYEDSLIIVDECQNLSMDELKAITTRIGENSKMILCGDETQSDIRNGQDIVTFVKLCEKNGISIPVIKFTPDDIVRSDIVAALVRMFYKEGI